MADEHDNTTDFPLQKPVLDPLAISIVQRAQLAKLSVLMKRISDRLEKQRGE
jgi:hypothetical protein